MVLERLAMMMPFCEFCSLVRILVGRILADPETGFSFHEQPFLNIFVVFIEQLITVQGRSLAEKYYAVT